MEFNQLRYFVSLAQTSNVTRSAEQLHITQSALSRVLKRLEDELGVELFSRSNGRLELNHNGARFLKHAEKILAELDDALEELSPEKKVSILSCYFHGFYSDIAQYLQFEYSDHIISFSNQNETESSNLASTDCDMIIAPRESIPKFRPLCSVTDKWCAMMNASYELRSGCSANYITLPELAQEKIVLLNSACDRDLITGAFEQAGLSPDLMFTDNAALSGAMISRGERMTLASHMTFYGLHQKHFAPVYAMGIDGGLFDRRIYLHIRSGIKSRQVMDICRRFAELIESRVSEQEAAVDEYIRLDRHEN